MNFPGECSTCEDKYCDSCASKYLECCAQCSAEQNKCGLEYCKCCGCDCRKCLDCGLFIDSTEESYMVRCRDCYHAPR